MLTSIVRPLALASALLLAAGIAGSASGARAVHSTTLAKPSRGIDALSIKSPVTITLWHSYAGTNAEAFARIVQMFERKYPNINVESQFVGGYGDLHQKIVAALQANAPPHVSIAYENDALAYLPSKQVLDLTPYVKSRRYGESSASLATIVPVELRRNTYLMAGGRHYSWPFQLSQSVMYYNQDMLRSVGISSPPKTWDDFLADCATIKSKLNKKCFSMVADASTIDGFAMSFGAPTGMVTQNGTKTAFRLPSWFKALKLYEDLVKNGYGSVNSGAEQLASGDMADFASQRAAFIIRTSLNIKYLEDAIKDSFRWGVAIPPQGAGRRKPVTVLYGPNLTAFKHSSAQENLASWLFVKFASSTGVQVGWAANTGLLPVRTDAVKSKRFQAILASDPRIKASLAILPNALFEAPLNTKGLVAVIPGPLRTLVQNVQSAVMAGAMDAGAAQRQLISEGDKIMAGAG